MAGHIRINNLFSYSEQTKDGYQISIMGYANRTYNWQLRHKDLNLQLLATGGAKSDTGAYAQVMDEINTRRIKDALNKEYAERDRRWGLSAFIAGFWAAAGGKFESECPYTDKRTTDGKTTFARGYINVWLKGHRAYMAVSD